MTGYPNRRGNAADSNATSSNVAVLDGPESSSEHLDAELALGSDQATGEEVASGFFRKTRPGAEYWLG